ncbi:hypothetical protein NDU88_005237 [Pleurodeles waltl]|uniref:Uncharacterized protein n=1 Tax=Pleurodeles waltl TaxID=8319 RepID=A0AAV7PES7_PLEWA|nr:hypothetical protein NDU88_005237 [Pleurodeles waltl]
MSSFPLVRVPDNAIGGTWRHIRVSRGSASTSRGIVRADPVRPVTVPFYSFLQEVFAVLKTLKKNAIQFSLLVVS